MFSDEARKEFIRRAPGIAGVLLLASCVSVIPHAVTAQQQSQQMLISGHVSYSRISPPTAGVKVLEDIFQRVRSAPQIAMARNLMKQQQQVATANDPLQIRPKKTGGRALPAPGLQIIAQNANAPTFNEGLAGVGVAGSEGSIPVSSRAEPEVIMGARTFPLTAASQKPSAPGMWESRQNTDQLERSRTQQPPDLATATGRLFGIMNGLQQAQNAGNVIREHGTPQMNMGKNLRSNETIAYQESDGYLAADKESNVKADARRRDAGAKDKDSTAAGAAAKRKVASALTPAQAKESKEEAGATATYRGINLDEKKAKLAMADIALLPPNVVTGIPLVHLGSSEQQASGALQSIGSMKQQKVQKWTVWSWARPQTKTGTSLQLYMRNGLLDAMRIFDSSLIGTDFGVNVGDSMGRVKEKFGEPAFIVDEPQPGAGRNYIYPISQIGFQLARPAPGDQPRVVSVLIFNVK